ncbi:AraC family transcriptional regulator [Paenibacillus sp. ACRRX]|uniref:helix-turn-helix domain-containing protein n=1 Tax=Paenibacillus sp. ACRRX TaxID=2918206 RepID=UPI001EF6F80A|nr:helix-turn-helix domain-containing protein [Paenibacillus sp. ACRRX]MCG7405962.1 AraC family transcriptional regulator [Paenibacillus sp. ACRRX]
MPRVGVVVTLDVIVTNIHDYFDQFTEVVNGQVQHTAWDQRLSIPSPVGNGSITRTRIRPGMEIVYADVTFQEDMKLRIQEACGIFELSYCVSGEIYCAWDGKESYTSKETSGVLCLEDVQVYEEKKAGIHHQLLEIRLEPSELFHYAGDVLEKHQIETWLQRHKGSIDRVPDSSAIQRCVSDLIHCTYTGTMKRLYMESKAMEYIALFGEIDGLEVTNPQLNLQRNDMDRLHDAKQLIVSHYEHPLSIRQLARLVGLNEFKLKKGFRERYGMTIFELVRRERMEKALWHMEVEQMNVGEAAVSVGYSNASNFTTMFRKHYGCNPSEYVRRMKQQDMKRGFERQ